jgi:hypothetical protein
MSEFGSLNSVGEPGSPRMSAYGGNDGRGPVDNVLPTGIVARGNEVRAGDVYDKGERRGMSTARNASKARGMSERK